ncbi:hypothetical protein BD324DRAFT_650053 [Kockovaella imperatae]|uniref:RRM domain-containing protein n=1 Tax=Kockovaella imperatae TaxID=4999 RepID=A0A1Y1UMG7_9TREE|nr:hypothetical protein BD324DRAFT_650053 [Kockovaella imperatae]ORX38707.1 hypothetical protein BD324DRAFT_650053 [Kockovaella imperatae]
MARAKPYQRSSSDSSVKRGNSDGLWRHDLHQSGYGSPSSSKSLLARMSSDKSNGSKPKPSLLDRISGGKGRELIPSSSKASSTSSSEPKLFGFGSNPVNVNSNPNAGLELIPGSSATRRNNGGNGSQLNKGRLVQSGFDAALGTSQPRRQVVRPLIQERESVSILGAGRSTVLVRVENLAVGTTADDVVSAFASTPIENARVTSPSTSSTVTVELDVSTRAAADDLIQRYDGAVADGNALRVQIVKQSLVERMGGATSGGAGTGLGPMRNGSSGARRNGAGQELLGPTSGSKMYSDTILISDPSASIITLAQQQEQADRLNRAQRADAWSRGAPTLLDRMSGGGRRGQIAGGGRSGGMMVD